MPCIGVVNLTLTHLSITPWSTVVLLFVVGQRQAIDPFVANPDFEPKQIEKASKACTAICMWVRAMHKYNQVAKQVEPKRKLLAEKQVRSNR